MARFTYSSCERADLIFTSTSQLLEESLQVPLNTHQIFRADPCKTLSSRKTFFLDSVETNLTERREVVQIQSARLATAAP